MDFIWSLFGLGSTTAAATQGASSSSSSEGNLTARVSRYIGDFLGTDRHPSYLMSDFDRFKKFVSIRSQADQLPQIDDNALWKIVQTAVSRGVVPTAPTSKVQQAIDGFTDWLTQTLGKPGMAQYVKNNKLQNINNLNTLN